MNRAKKHLAIAYYVEPVTEKGKIIGWQPIIRLSKKDVILRQFKFRFNAIKSAVKYIESIEY